LYTILSVLLCSKPTLYLITAFLLYVGRRIRPEIALICSLSIIRLSDTRVGVYTMGPS